MGKIVVLLTLCFSFVFAEIEWMSYDDALKQAKNENKIIMVMLSKEGCPACDYMEDIVFENDDVMELFNKDFVGVHLDIHEDYIPTEYTFIGTPTFHFINKFERKIDRLDGGANSKDFSEKLKEVLSNK